jgi:hypothetical protein
MARTERPHAAGAQEALRDGGDWREATRWRPYSARGMCMQCMATAITAVGAASGTRAYLGSRRYAWLTPKRLRAITILLAIGAVFVSATLVSGSG